MINSGRNQSFIDKYLLGVVTVVLILVLLPISLSINFHQNDDWVYYKVVESFMNGNFRLDPLTAPIFYVQGLLGTTFAAIFGIRHLPVLTLIVSALNFYFFAKILVDSFEIKKPNAVLVGLVLFLNPLHIYSLLGFMTENYFLFFTLISIYFISQHKKTNNSRNFIAANIFIILSFFVRHVAYITSISYAISLLIRKKYSQAAIQLVLFMGLIVFYLFVFPRTQEMNGKQLDTQALLSKPREAFSLWYVGVIYTVASILPLALFFPIKDVLKKKKIKLAIGILLVCISFVLLKFIFTPKGMPHDQFPYLDNTWYSNGFYKILEGDKYDYPGRETFHKYWDLFAKILVSFIPLIILVYKKKTLNFYSIYFVIYLTTLLLIGKVYDRYFLYLIPVGILFILSLSNYINKVTKAALIGFILFLSFYTYLFAMEYVITNRYVWDRSEDLSKEVNKGGVLSTSAWNKQFLNLNDTYRYRFTFKTNDYECCTNLIETKKVKFPLSIYKDANVYLFSN